MTNTVGDFGFEPSGVTHVVDLTVKSNDVLNDGHDRCKWESRRKQHNISILNDELHIVFKNITFTFSKLSVSYTLEPSDHFMVIVLRLFHGLRQLYNSIIFRGFSWCINWPKINMNELRKLTSEVVELGLVDELWVVLIEQVLSNLLITHLSGHHHE